MTPRLLTVVLTVAVATLVAATDMSFEQTPSKWTDGFIWSMEEPFNMDITDPQFKITNPREGISIVPDTSTLIVRGRPRKCNRKIVRD